MKKKVKKAKKAASKKRVVKRKPVRGAKKKVSKKKAASKRAAKTTVAKMPKPIGKVTHFYTNIGVAIVKFKQNIRSGTALHFKGATTDFVETPKSMQYDHKPIATAPKGKEIGIKVKKRVRDGDLVYVGK